MDLLARDPGGEERTDAPLLVQTEPVRQPHVRWAAAAQLPHLFAVDVRPECLVADVERGLGFDEMGAGGAVGAVQARNDLAAGPADVQFLALAHLAVEHLVGLIQIVGRVLVAKPVSVIAAVLQERRDQGGQVPLRLVVVPAAGIVSLAQPAALSLDRLERQRGDFPGDDALPQALVGVEPRKPTGDPGTAGSSPSGH